MHAAVPAFCGEPLDRADKLRADPERLAALSANGVLLKLDGLQPALDDAGRLAWRSLAEAPSDAERVFLGLLPDGRAAFATVPGEGNAKPAHAQREIWRTLALLSAEDLAIYGTARSVLDWNARERFCPGCGRPTRSAHSGWQRRCDDCAADHFPRVNPVAIMLVECERKLLLGRGERFPPRAYSALAGFVEPGESIEAAVRREVLEEAGVPVGAVRYIASQPWPFPAQLMIGCLGRADSLDLVVDTTEIEDARWFTRDEVAEALAKGSDSASFVPPPAQAIAHYLLTWWLEDQSGNSGPNSRSSSA